MADLAEAQHGVVSFRQLRQLGFSKGHISRAYEADRLRRIHRGVYAVGHARISPHGRCMAAVLACGAGTVLSHHSAAWLWGFLPACPKEAAVTVLSQGHRRRGIRVYRVAGLSSRDYGALEGIPVTSVERTLIDLGAVATARNLTSAVDRAKRLGRLDLDALDAILLRRGHTVAGKRLEKALELYRRPVFDRARSELLFLDAIEKEGLPTPVLNCWVEKWEIDAYWEDERFAVEVDGWETHGTRKAFEEDRLRLEEMKLAGIDCIPISARRIEREPEQVAARLRVLLTRRRAELGRSPTP
ncbi:MAG TPA: type IV toxin-antitoxin system AbiEi family antitoxin domain-containing protein [Solirubrobacterales bacterium]